MSITRLELAANMSWNPWSSQLFTSDDKELCTLAVLVDGKQYFLGYQWVSGTNWADPNYRAEWFFNQLELLYRELKHLGHRIEDCVWQMVPEVLP